MISILFICLSLVICIVILSSSVVVDFNGYALIRSGKKLVNKEGFVDVLRIFTWCPCHYKWIYKAWQECFNNQFFSRTNNVLR